MNSGAPQLCDLYEANFDELVKLLELQDAPLDAPSHQPHLPTEELPGSSAAPPRGETLSVDFINLAEHLKQLKTEPVAASAATVIPTAAVATVSPVERTLTPSMCANGKMDQVIVGYFCKYALKYLKQLMSDLPCSLEVLSHLKRSMKELWAQWVGSLITKPMLLETVKDIFRESCPAAANIDIVEEYRTWYKRQRDLSRMDASSVLRSHTSPSATLY